MGNTAPKHLLSQSGVSSNNILICGVMWKQTCENYLWCSAVVGHFHTGRAVVGQKYRPTHMSTIHTYTHTDRETER
ncbi:hypothetical protein LSH36_201g04076 [Paralvinella palmiformis]|uniref:Uncharacterized protein n=1 Tax=Paralvinella palmiformis TaxID=53620 RepID=A0AAD9JPT0_9ANNE|nr:hypothetical protein LSH36_201g04076 [Paralvinella palmiformis]